MTVNRQFEILSGEYLARPLSSSDGAFLAEIQHVHRRDGQTLFTPVGYLSGFKHPDADMTHPHWSIRFFVDARIRYESQSRTSTLLWDINLQSKEHGEYRKRLEELRDSDLPPVHPDLPQALGGALLLSGWCSKPMHFQVFTATLRTSIEFGEVFHDDSN